MTWRHLLRRELHVAIHAQSWRFRVIKYLVLFVIAYSIYAWGGWRMVLNVFAILFVLAIAMHFVYRHMTHKWTRSWGGYKKLDLPS